MATAKRALVEDSASIKAAKGLGKIIAIAIILVVAGFGDVMYIVAMGSKFPSGPLLVVCYIGAFTSFAAVGYLLLGKSISFRPGAQMLGAWIVFVMELLIIAMNILLVFAGSHPSGLMDAWASISPASPVLHMIGVALIYFMDPELIEKHKDMELAAKLADQDRKYTHALETAKINLKQKHLDFTVTELENAVNSPESQSYIRREAIRMNQLLLGELSGRAVPEIGSPASPISADEASKLDKLSVDNDGPSYPLGGEKRFTSLELVNLLKDDHDLYDLIHRSSSSLLALAKEEKLVPADAVVTDGHDGDSAMPAKRAKKK